MSLRMTTVVKTMTTSADEDVGKEEHLFIVDQMQTDAVTVKISVELHQNAKNRSTT